MPNTKNVTVAKPKTAGAIFRAPIGTALPESVSAALNEAFKNLGYVSEDGTTNATSIETGQIKAWGGEVVGTYQNGKKDTFKFTLIEALNLDVLKAVHGDKNVIGTDIETGIKILVNGDDQLEHSWVVDMILQGSIAKRIVIPFASVIEIGNVVYKDNQPVGYTLTIQAVPDSTGNYHHEYIQKISTAEPANVEEGTA